MIVISMMISSEAHELNNFNKAVNIVRENLHISYGKSHSELSIYSETQKGLPYALGKRF